MTGPRHLLPTNPNSQPVPPVHAAVRENTSNELAKVVGEIDAFTQFIDDWIKLNVKTFSRKENQP